MPSPERIALRTRINCSQHLTDLRQKADLRIATWETSGLRGDKSMAVNACRSVEAQATAEGITLLVEEYERKRWEMGLLDSL